MNFKRVFAAAAAAGAVFSSPAGASVTINSITASPAFATGRLLYSPGGLGGVASRTSLDAQIGRMRMTGIDNTTMAAVTFDTYCIDILHFVQRGTFEIQAFTLRDATKNAQLIKLLSHTAGFIDAAATSTAKRNVSAAIQMAVWEIVNESGSGSYSLGGGLFQIASNYGTVVPTARNLAQSYLDSMGGWSSQNDYGLKMMTAINPISNQRQVFLAVVPEPSAWALMILGFGLVGGAMRKSARVRRTAVTFA